MGLMAYNWVEIQHLHLKSLGAKTTGKIWIYFRIRKFWDTYWDVWIYRNLTLRSPDGPTKTENLRLIKKIITYHLNRGTLGLPPECHFLVHTYIHTLLSRPYIQRLSYLSGTSSARICSQISTIRRRILD